jgi:hypothetical protein
MIKAIIKGYFKEQLTQIRGLNGPNDHKNHQKNRIGFQATLKRIMQTKLLADSFQKKENRPNLRVTH